MAADQLPLLPEPVLVRKRARPAPVTRPAATENPVARVAVLTPLPHLDRPLDYLVPEALAAQAQPGVRVRVRLAGRLVDGFLLERRAQADTDRTLQPIRSVHGPPVLTAEVAQVCHEVAERYAGTFADVVRSAVPPRHARVEATVLADDAGSASIPGAPVALARTPEDLPPAPDLSAWTAQRGGRALVQGLGTRPGPRVSWCSGPGEDLPARIAELAVQTVRAGLGVLVVAADGADVGRFARALGAAGLPVVDLTARSGPQARYRAFLRILGGELTVVVGTRAAVFSPVRDLGLIVVVDDADESLGEPHAPGWHAREVAALRAHGTGATLVLAGPSVSLEAERMVAIGWLAPVGPTRTGLRAAAPLVQAAQQAAGRDPARATSRIPGVALEVMREAVERGPVLVSVARAGYLPFLLCDTCREQVTCPQCGLGMRAEGPGGSPVCANHPGLPAWHCPHCGSTRIRAGVVGVRRTAEEFGRALPRVPVTVSSAESGIVRELRPAAGIVVATPGSSPDPGPDGYAALVILDVAAALSRPGLRVPEEVLRRWFLDAAVVRPATVGGRVLIVGDESLREVQALIRWDPRGYAQRSIDERLALSLPPAVRVARLVGPAIEVGGLVERLRAGLGHRLLRASGPVPAPLAEPGDRMSGASGGEGELIESASPDGSADRAQWQVSVALSDGPRLSALLRSEQSARSARRAPVITVRIDPMD